MTPTCWLSVAASAVDMLLGRVGAPSLRQEPCSRGAAPGPACPLGLAFWEMLLEGCLPGEVGCIHRAVLAQGEWC